ncbi:MAG TPA: YdeI/OmpD-associated family protein [Flavitalea sp.]|nr:YdeI/OmpD-associated family protein [Flavitalea sp.]
MPLTDPRVDAYIEKSQPFAQPILQHLRQLVHKACPEITETIKWGFPNFDYKGIVCNMAAFKAHCAFGFWKAALMKDADKFLEPVGKTAMGHFNRLTKVDDLPSDKIMISYIKEAVALNEMNIAVPKKKVATRQATAVHEGLMAALKKNKKAFANFEKMSPSYQKDYHSWINEAKTDATRTRRIETAVEWILEGKGRNWKYERP